VNVVDSCGWLEHFLDGSNRAFFTPVLKDTSKLIVPSVSVYEVCRRVLMLYGVQQADMVRRAMTSVTVVQLDATGMYQAALASKEYQLHMADAIIWQTAQSHAATLYTQDAGLQRLPGVVYQAKSTNTVG